MKKILRIILLVIAAFLSLQIVIFWLLRAPEPKDMTEIEFRQAVELGQIVEANFRGTEVYVVDQQAVESRVPVEPTKEFRDQLRQQKIRVNYEGPVTGRFSSISHVLMPLTLMVLVAAFLL